jgi:dihydrofolate reductase
MKNTNLNIIVAMDKTGLIGNNGKLPWNSPSDLKYFKEITETYTVVMGRKTWESIGKKPLKNRRNVVLTSSSLNDFNTDLVFINSPAQVFDITGEVFIIGGRHLYQYFLPLVNKLYITEIFGKYDGDVYFPEFNRDEFNLKSEIKCNVDGNVYRVFERK